MADREKIIRKRPRSDIGKPHKKYNSTKDNTGKVGKEPPLLNAFWKAHRVANIMLLTSTELDELIDQWLKNYVERRLKTNKNWDYPDIPRKTLNEIRNTRTNIDKGWHL